MLEWGMPLEPSDRKYRHKSVLELPPHEIPWHWQALTFLAIGTLMIWVMNESAVQHRHASGLSEAPRIDINYSSVEELESLPGIGSALAKAIIASRPYASAEDLARVRGIGPRQAARLRSLIQATQGRRTADTR